jgi:hypothetical protein
MDGGTSMHEALVSNGFACAVKPDVLEMIKTRMVDSNSVVQLAADLQVPQESACNTQIASGVMEILEMLRMITNKIM